MVAETTPGGAPRVSLGDCTGLDHLAVVLRWLGLHQVLQGSVKKSHGAPRLVRPCASPTPSLDVKDGAVEACRLLISLKRGFCTLRDTFAEIIPYKTNPGLWIKKGTMKGEQ